MDMSFTVTVIKEEPNEKPNDSSNLEADAMLDPDADCKDMELKQEELAGQETRTNLSDLFSLYEGHVVKEDVVIGPVDLQQAGPAKKQIDKGSNNEPSSHSHEAPNSNEVYMCDVCQKQYKSWKGLVYHMKHHRHIETHSCQVCKKEFRSHVSKMLCEKCIGLRKTVVNLICDICNKVFNRKLSLINHLRLHSDERPYACEICMKAFTTMQNLSNHVTRHSGIKPPKKFSCNLCDKKFPFKSRLLRHQFLMHSGKKPFPCHKCDMRFKCEKSLTYHLRLHTGDRPYSCDTCKHTFTNKYSVMNHIIGVHSDVKPVKKWSCDLCDQKFTYKSRLRYHKRVIHAREEIYSCSMCDKAFIYKNALVIHLRKHTGATPFTCDICHKSFASSSGLNIHNSAVHFGQKTHECEICNKMFKTNGSLREHVKTHTREKLYECDVCKRRFAQKATLRVHRIVHTSKRPYTCDICKRSFRLRHNIIGHIRNHYLTDTPYSCELCERKFKSTELMKSHLRVHVEKTYVCDICEQMFTNKLRLKTHIDVHNYEEQFAGGSKERKLKPKLKPAVAVVNGTDMKIKEEPVDEEAAIDELYLLLYADHVKAEIVTGPEELQEPVTHTKPAHEGNTSTQHRCKVCNCCFYTASALSVHSETHRPPPRGAPGKAEFVCDVCGRYYSGKVMLARHRKVHADGETSSKPKYRYPWACRECGRRFLFKCRLLEHQSVHDKKFVCGMCSFRFASKKALNKHMARHNYPCDVCDKMLTTKQGYLSHLRVHSDECLMSCNVCGEKYRSQSQLLSHQRSHNDEEMMCKLCNKILRNGSALVDHLRVHTFGKSFT